MKAKVVVTSKCVCLLGGLLLLTSCHLLSNPVDLKNDDLPTPIMTIAIEDPVVPTETEEIPTITPELQTIPLTLGYYTGEQVSYDAIQEFSSYIQIVSASIYFVGSDGTIAGQDDFDVASLNRNQGIQTLACISNYNGDYEYDFDPARAHLAIVEKKEELINSLVWLAMENNYAGINIDFENIAFSEDIEDDRNAFSQFISDLAVPLHDNGLILVVSVPAKFHDLPEEPWTYPYDYSALGEAADYLQLMTYNEHGSWSEYGFGGEPGPVAGIDWMEQILTYAVSLVDPSKLLIGLPAYGYDWNLSASDIENGVYAVNSFNWNDAQSLINDNSAEIQWDEVSASPFFTYEQENQQHEVWYENTESIQLKSDLVQKYSLAGMSMWAMGYEDESFWQAVVAGMQ